MKDIQQGRFPWVTPANRPREVALDPETTKRAIALLARAMMTVVRAAGETTDDR